MRLRTRQEVVIPIFADDGTDEDDFVADTRLTIKIYLFLQCYMKSPMCGYMNITIPGDFFVICYILKYVPTAFGE